jgi:hypothetical protein
MVPLNRSSYLYRAFNWVSILKIQFSLKADIELGALQVKALHDFRLQQQRDDRFVSPSI